MKIFKRIYYPLMVVLFALMFALSFVNATVGNKKNDLGDDFITKVDAHINSIATVSHNSVYADKQDAVSTYITKTLTEEAQINRGTSYIDSQETIYEFALNDQSKPAPTFVVQKDVITEETLKFIDEARGDADTSIWEVDKTISNIVVYIPGQKTLNNYSGDQPKATGDVLMMMAHYDSRIEGAGASDNSAQVASMLQNIIHITKNNTTFDNDLLFVFTDAKEEGMLGAFTFKHQFVGFDEIYSRVKLGTNFDALGNRGTLAMFNSSDNYNLISAYGKINGNTFTSSMAGLIYDGVATYSDFDIYGDIPSLNFANVGGGEILHTAHDNIDNVSKTTLIQHANMMFNIIDTFGSYDLSKLEGGKDAVYFSYLDVFTIAYSVIVSYVFGLIMICLLIGIIVLNKRNKVFSWTKTGSGAVVQLLSILGSVVALFALYFLFSLLASAMGLIPIRAIGRLTNVGLGLLISFMLLSVVSSSFLSIVFRKLFSVNSSDIVRGNVFLWTIIGLILAFAAPQFAYFFAITAVLELLVLLLVTALSARFKDKFGMPIGKLFPYLLPILIAVPMIIPVIAMANAVLSTLFIPLLMILFMLMTGYFTPYCVLITPYMQSLFAALPQASRRVEKEVTETIEDKAKKGKFVQKTSIVIVKEKYNINYRHGYLATVLVALLSIMAIVFSCLGYGIGKNYSGYGSYREAVYNSSMVLVWEKIDNNNETTFLQVGDFMAYRYISDAIGGFSWSFTRDAYVKDIYNTSNIIKSNPSIAVADTNKYNFSVLSPERSLVTLKLSDAELIRNITITSNDGDEFEYENSNRSDTIVINLPYRFGSFTLEISGTDNITVEYTETIMDVGNSIANLAELEDWKDVMDFYAGKAEIANYLNSGIVFRIVKNKI